MSGPGLSFRVRHFAVTQLRSAPSFHPSAQPKIMQTINIAIPGIYLIHP